MKMESVEVFCSNGYVLIGQEKEDSTISTVSLTPEQCALVAQWILDAAKTSEDEF